MSRDRRRWGSRRSDSTMTPTASPTSAWRAWAPNAPAVHSQNDPSANHRGQRTHDGRAYATSAATASSMPTKFLCIGYGVSRYTGPVSPAASWLAAFASVSRAMPRQGSRNSVSPSLARPLRPTAHPTTSAPPTDSQAWNHSTVLARYGLTSTVKAVAAW